MSKRWIKTGAAFAAGALIALFAALGRDAFAQGDPVLRWQYLSDAFFVAAVALGSVGALAFVAADGFFDMIGFGVKKLLSLLRRDDERLHGSFFEYKRAKMAARGGGSAFLLVPAAVYLAAAGICLWMYMGAL